MADFVLKAGDTSPALTATLTDDTDTAIRLGGATVRFQMRPAHDSDAALTVDEPVSIVDADAGQVRYDWTPADTATPGRYIAEFDIEYSDGTTETVPNTGWFTIQIHEEL